MSWLAGRGDILAGGFLLIFASGPGQTWFIALSGPALRGELGLSHGTFGVLYALATLASGTLLLWLGAAVDRLPARHMAVPVTLGLGLACLAMAAVADPILLVATLFGLRLCGQGLMTHLALTTVARGFPVGRGRALSLAALGFNAGEALLPLAVAAAIAGLGWRPTWAVTGACVILVLPALSAFLLRRAPSPMPQDPGGGASGLTRGQIVRSARFALLLPALLSTGFIATALFFHQGAIATAKAWPAGWFAICVPVYAVTSIAANLLSGLLVDRIGARAVLPWFVLPLALGVALLAASNAPYAALLAMALVGLTAGSGNTVLTAGLAEIYGMASLGTVRALAAAAMVLASAASPAIAGLALDAGTPVAAILLAFAGMAVVAGPLAARGAAAAAVARSSA
ncbi:MAG: MFS transporter [Geminicoccaceae bacterium]